MRAWIQRLAVLTVCAVLAGCATSAPRQLTSGAMPEQNNGAVLLSVRSQMQLVGPLYLWFVREGGDPSNSKDLIQFSRGQGVPLLGTNMFSSEPKVYSIPAGRYRLLAHIVHCSGTVPEPGTVCVMKINGSPAARYPTARYSGSTPTFTVEAGKFTDAGEFILEMPAHAAITPDSKWSEIHPYDMSMLVRWKPIVGADALKAAYAVMPAVNSPVEVPANYVSNVKCETIPEGQHNDLHIPFRC